MKYTLALFRAPDGRSFEGEGLSPDIEVIQDERAAAGARYPAARGASFLRLR